MVPAYTDGLIQVITLAIRILFILTRDIYIITLQIAPTLLYASNVSNT